MSTSTLPKRFSYPSPGFSDYWQSPVGKKMLNTLGYTPTEEDTKAYNLNLIYKYDELADDIVHEVFEKQGYLKGHEILNTILEKGIDSVNNAHPLLQKLFEEIDQPPVWVDRQKVEKGAAFCRRTGAFGFIVLRNYCLMGGYESAAINKPLIYTGALKKGAAKRMAETLDFWVNVTAPNSLERFSIGFNNTVRVRMIHAFSRVYIKKNIAWNNEEWGVPLNHGDMVATNLGFSLVFLEGIRKLGFKPSEEEVVNLFHFWKYIGYLLGIPIDYLPDTEKQAIESLYKWTIAQPMADEDTKTLAISLMNEPLSSSFLKYQWQKRLLVKAHLGYNYFFLDDRACNTMGLPTTVYRYVPYLSVLLNGMKENRILSSEEHYQKAVLKGRARQEFVRTEFMKGHAHQLAPRKH